MAMRVLACLLLLAVPAVHAQMMYKCKDERGRWVFSDKPLPGCAGAVEVPVPKSAAPQSPPPAAGKTPTRAAAGPLRKPPKPVPMTEQERAQFTSECKAAREQLEWLLGPRGEGVEQRETRVGQQRQVLSQCPG
jgi:hypothetical protein